MTNTNPNDRIVSSTFACILALTVFRLVSIFESTLDLHFDEAQYWDWSQHIAWGYVSKPPMIAWIIAATTGLFGDSEAAIRLSAPLLHAITAGLIFALANRLYGKLAGFWSAVLYATLPSVSYSSLILSTDVVLMPFWVLALGAWEKLSLAPSRGRAIRLGIWIGLGLLAKYAMAYFILCAAVHFIISKHARKNCRPAHLGLAALVALLIVSPNLVWNAAHGWATFSHTADNADWQGVRKGGVMPALEFLGSQVAMFGPILLLAALWQIARENFRHLDESIDGKALLLLAFSLPVLIIVTIQALIAGAHVNWAAPTYIALTIFVVKQCLDRAPACLPSSAALHLLIMLFLCFSFAGFMPRSLPHKFDIFAKLKGWDRVASLINHEMEAYPGYSLLVDERKYAELFNYYLRGKPYPIVIWPGADKNHNQFSMTHSIDMKTGQHVILASRWQEPYVEHHFEHETLLGDLSVLPSRGETRHFYLFACEGLAAAP
jgi:4-amino-4-deoxy-L-arabinose transferase-like glycosyltransferase